MRQPEEHRKRGLTDPAECPCVSYQQVVVVWGRMFRERGWSDLFGRASSPQACMRVKVGRMPLPNICCCHSRRSWIGVGQMRKSQEIGKKERCREKEKE